MKTLYTAWIPSLSKDIFISELTTRQQKELIKSILSPFNFEFTKNSNILLEEVIQSDIDIKSLTLIDKFLVLLKLRAVSISDKVEYELKCPKCEKEIKTQTTLSTIINQLNHLDFPFNYGAVYGNYIISGDLPTIETELAFEETNTALPENYGELYGEILIRDVALFIRDVTISSNNKLQKLDFGTLPFLERYQIVEKFPIKLLQEIWTKIVTIKKSLEVPLLKVTCPCGAQVIDSKLSVTTPIYSSFLKSIFNENLHAIYQNIYYMTKILKFTPEYVESMAPGERAIYWGYYNRDMKEQQSKGEKNSVDIPG